jgi:hypothetical protein
MPAQGDANADVTFAAKGRAISYWEEAEVAFSRLYAAFSGSPETDTHAQRLYGERLNFKDRFAGLQRAAYIYFLKCPDQTIEGEFWRLEEMAMHLSVRRNEITHSWVQPMSYERQLDRLPADDSLKWTWRYWFFLVPPTYTRRKLDPNDLPAFVYTSAEIMRYANAFNDLRFYADRLAAVIKHPSRRSSL